MWKALTSGLLLAALAHPAWALSCAAPSLASTFGLLHAAEETYIIVDGRFIPRDGQSVRPPLLNDGEAFQVEAQFHGRVARADGFADGFSVPVTIEVGCAGPWCGQVPRGDVIAFLERRAGAYVLNVGPCPFSSFAATPWNRATAISCLRAEACEAPVLR